MHNPPCQLPWDDATWNEIQAAVHAETRRVAIAQKFLPLHGPMPGALTAPSHAIAGDAAGRLTIREATVAPLVEIWSNFALTPQQVAEEGRIHAGRTLAVRATNAVTRAQDALVFRGDRALADHSLFTGGAVSYRSGPAGRGLLPKEAAEPADAIAVEPSGRDAGREARYGEQTVSAVTEAYGRLQDRGHYGPYALVLAGAPYGDVFQPARETLILPADRIQPLVPEGLYGTGGLPPSVGLFVSVGGDTMDLVVGHAAAAEYLFDDENGKSRFRVRCRFALRLKDPSAVLRFDFRAGQPRPARRRKPSRRRNKGAAA